VGYARAHPKLLIATAITLLAMIGVDALIIARRKRYEAETDRLRAAMTSIERQRTDQILAREQSKLRVAVELIRRQAKLEPALHLSVAMDSGAMYLEAEGSLLRRMPVDIGPEQRVGMAPDTVHLATPRGVRTIARVLGEADAWEVPEWLYADKGVPLPDIRVITGALGPAAILLDGGTMIYAMPTRGPLSDSTYVLPGSIRARAEDMRAILPNLSAGMRVYFY
jgi:hypothetical protein